MGFASSDSDYDVRFIYVRKAEYFLKLEETRDVIEWQLDDILDINGWDCKRYYVCFISQTLRFLNGIAHRLFTKQRNNGEM